MTAVVDFQDSAWLRRERKLLKQVRRGDRQALGELYGVMAPVLYRRVILCRVGQAEVAEDVLAETFVTAIKRIDDFQDRGKSIFSWLARIAVNKAMDVHRKRARGLRAQERLRNQAEPATSEELNAQDLLSQGDDHQRQRERLEEVLAEIKPRYRKAVEMRFLQNRSREDCAEHLQVKLGTFDVLLHRALRAMRKAWGPGDMGRGGLSHE